jgi:ATP adenylyltransferase
MTVTLNRQPEPSVVPISEPTECRMCGLSARESVPFDSGDSFAVPSFGAMVPGWMLIVPRTHVYSLAELDDREWAGFSTFLAAVRSKVEAVFGQTVIFEHGSAGAGRKAGCGVEHAHLHIVPLAVDLRAVIRGVRETVGDYQWQATNARPSVPVGMDYIYVEDATGSWITFAEALPSQVVRQALASRLGLTKWDWKDDHRTSVMSETLARLGHTST